MKEKVEVIRTDVLLVAAKATTNYEIIEKAVSRCKKGTKDRSLLLTRELKFDLLATSAYHDVLKICNENAFSKWSIEITGRGPETPYSAKETKSFLCVEDAVAYLEEAYKTADVAVSEFLSWYLIEAQMDDADAIIRALRAANT